MASGIDAVSSNSMHAMLTSYRNINDTTGAKKKAATMQADRQESPRDRMLQKGKNNTAVYVETSVTTENTASKPKIAKPQATTYPQNPKKM